MTYVPHEFRKLLESNEADVLFAALHELEAIMNVACDATNPLAAVTAFCVAFEVGFGLDLFEVAPDRELYTEFMRRLGPLTKIQPGGIEGPQRLRELRAQLAPQFERLDQRLKERPTRDY